MSGLTGMLFENSPFADDESRELMQGAQDQSASSLLSLADPGFAAMYEDPSALNAGLLGLGVTPLGPAAKGAGKVVDASRYFVDKGRDVLKSSYRKWRSALDESQNTVRETKNEIRKRFGLSDGELERLTHGLSYEGEVYGQGFTPDAIAELTGAQWSPASVGEITEQLASKHAWASRLTPAAYQNRLQDAGRRLLQEEERVGGVGAMVGSPEKWFSPEQMNLFKKMPQGQRRVLREELTDRSREIERLIQESEQKLSDLMRTNRGTPQSQIQVERKATRDYLDELRGELHEVDAYIGMFTVLTREGS